MNKSNQKPLDPRYLEEKLKRDLNCELEPENKIFLEFLYNFTKAYNANEEIKVREENTLNNLSNVEFYTSIVVESHKNDSVSYIRDVGLHLGILISAVNKHYHIKKNIK